MRRGRRTSHSISGHTELLGNSHRSGDVLRDGPERRCGNRHVHGTCQCLGWLDRLEGWISSGLLEFGSISLSEIARGAGLVMGEFALLIGSMLRKESR